MVMASNRVEVDLLIGRDLLTPALGRIRQMTDGMKSSFSGFQNGFLGGAAFSAAQTAIDGVTSSIRGMTRAIQEASQVETNSIVAASDIAAGLKIDLDPAVALVNNTQLQIAKIAAALPGEVQDFNAIFRQVASAIAPLSSNPLDFQNKALEISKRAGVLAVNSGADPDQSGSVLDRFISGTSTFSELALNDIFQKNSLLTNEIRRLMKESGFEPSQLKQMTAEARLDILDRALKVATPDKLIQKLQGTASTVIGDIWSKLFNPQTGLFGFLRQIPEMNNRSALDGFAGMLQSLFNLGTTIGSRIGFDPMEGLISFFDWVSDLSNRLNLMISGAIPFDLGDFYKGVSDFIGSVVDKVGVFVDGINEDQIGNAIGGLIVALLAALANNLPKLLVIALKTTYKVLNGLASAFFGAIGAFFVIIGKDIQTGLKAIVDPFLKPIRDFFNGIKRLFDQAMNLIPKVPSVSGAVGTAANIGGAVLRATNPIFGLFDGVAGIVNPKPKDAQGLPQPTGGNLTQPLVQPQTTGEGQKQSSNVFAPVLNFAEGSSDPRLMAQMVMSEINSQYRAFQQGSLT